MRAIIYPIVATLALGCGGADTNTTDDTSTAYAAALSVDAAQGESGLVAALATALGTAQLSTGEAAAASAQAATAVFTPQGCATAVVNGNVVTYTLNGCAGPYGLLHVTGTLTATFSAGASGALTVQLAGTGLKLSTATVSLATTATLSSSRTMATVMSTSSGTSAHGETMTHAGSYTASWDASCLSLSGSFMTSVGTIQWSTVVTGFHACRGMCPDAGGTVVVTGPMGGTVTVSYTNGATAEVTTSSGTRGMIVLACGAA